MNNGREKKEAKKKEKQITIQFNSKQIKRKKERKKEKTFFLD